MSRKIPNPYGRKGGPEHQQVVEEVVEDIENRGMSPIKEFFVKLLGLGRKRFIDIVAVEGETVKEFHQVGKVNKNGEPVKRERKVMEEIQDEYGIKVEFHSYNKE